MSGFYDGFDLPTLQAILAEYYTAYKEVQTGRRVEVAAYTQGDGARNVSYSKANAQEIRMEILAIQRAIDRLNGSCVNRRAPITPYFR